MRAAKFTLKPRTATEKEHTSAQLGNLQGQGQPPLPGTSQPNCRLRGPKGNHVSLSPSSCPKAPTCCSVPLPQPIRLVQTDGLKQTHASLTFLRQRSPTCVFKPLGMTSEAAERRPAADPDRNLPGTQRE